MDSLYSVDGQEGRQAEKVESQASGGEEEAGAEGLYYQGAAEGSYSSSEIRNG